MRAQPRRRLPDALDPNGLVQSFYAHPIAAERGALDRHLRVRDAHADASGLRLLPDLSVLETEEGVSGPARELAVVAALHLIRAAALPVIEAEVRRVVRLGRAGLGRDIGAASSVQAEGAVPVARRSAPA